MNNVIIGLLILVILCLMCFMLRTKNKNKTRIHSNTEKEKEKRLQEVRNFIKHHDEKITNNMIEKLGVSDATAERYLDELEHEGLIHQVGKTGRSTYYEKNDE